MIIEDERLYTLAETADFAICSEKTIRRRIEQGKLKKVTADREKIKIWGKEIKRWLTRK